MRYLSRWSLPLAGVAVCAALFVLHSAAQQATTPTNGLITLTIPAGTALTQQISLTTPCAIGAVQIPQTWTTADLWLRASADGTRWGPARDEFGERVSMRVIAGDDVVQVPAVATWTLRHLQFESTVNQADVRTLRVLCR